MRNEANYFKYISIRGGFIIAIRNEITKVMEEQNEQYLEIIETWEEIEVLIRQNKDKILSFNLKKEKENVCEP